MDRYFQIRSNLKVVIDADVPENERKVDKLFKIRPLTDRIRKGCTSVPRNQEVAIDEQMIPFSGMCHMKQFVRDNFSIFHCFTAYDIVKTENNSGSNLHKPLEKYGHHKLTKTKSCGSTFGKVRKSYSPEIGEEV
nr:unnamed protein product [Callosobruchus chinensis]